LLNTSSSSALAFGGPPFSIVADGVLLRVRLTPRAAAERIAGLAPEAGGGIVLKVGVTAVAEGGKANAALLALLAREWRLAKRDFSIVAGAADRRKTIHIAGDPAQLGALLSSSIARFATGPDAPP
jgi:uncharacterized protein (TIGR00251 family)